MGGPRLVRAEEPGGLRVRDARPSDRRLVWEWANDPQVRRSSFSSGPIPWTDHVAWFDRMLHDPDRLLLIGESGDGQAVGQVRFEPDSVSGHVIGVAIAAAHRGRGLAAPLITVAVQRWRADQPEAALRARIKARNRVSISAFSQAGFVAEDSAGPDDHVVMRQHPSG